MTTALEKINQQALEEIKDYSTGKKYFVSKFQDSVRKRNIKAKKKLIGYGNEGALSGAGPMEEQVEELDETIEKEGSKYCLKAKSGRNLGCSTSHAGAEKREREVNYFKHKKKKVKESVEIDEGLMQWINSRLRPSSTESGDTKKDTTPQTEEYIDVSKPDSGHELYVGAFPLPRGGQLDDAMTKFDFIINMSIDIKTLFGTNPTYQKYKEQQHKGQQHRIIDDFAFEDEDYDKYQYQFLTNPTEETAHIVQAIQQRVADETANVTKAAAKAKELVDAGHKVLITCTQGLNRSVLTAIMTLIALGKTNLDAYNLIKKARIETISGPVRQREEEEAARYGTRIKKDNELPKDVLYIMRTVASGGVHKKFRDIAGLPHNIEEALKKLIAQVLKETYNR